MQQVLDLLFNIDFTTYPEILLRLFLLVLLCAAIVYLIYVFINQLTVSSKVHRDFLLKINFLRTLIITQLMVSVYFYFLIKKIGTNAFQWSDKFFWLGFSPQLVLFIGIILLFFNYNGRFQRMIRG